MGEISPKYEGCGFPCWVFSTNLKYITWTGQLINWPEVKGIPAHSSTNVMDFFVGHEYSPNISGT